MQKTNIQMLVRPETEKLHESKTKIKPGKKSLDRISKVISHEVPELWNTMYSSEHQIKNGWTLRKIIHLGMFRPLEIYSSVGLAHL